MAAKPVKEPQGNFRGLRTAFSFQRSRIKARMLLVVMDGTEYWAVKLPQVQQCQVFLGKVDELMF